MLSPATNNDCNGTTMVATKNTPLLPTSKIKDIRNNHVSKLQNKLGRQAKGEIVGAGPVQDGDAHKISSEGQSSSLQQENQSDLTRGGQKFRKHTTFGAEGRVKQSGLFGTSANLINTIVGAGIIGMPYAFRQCGFIAGLALLALVGYLADKSLKMLIDTALFHPLLQNRHVTSFEKLASFPFGKAGRYFISLNMFVLAYGSMVAYLLIIKDTVPTLMGVAHGVKGGIERELILTVTSVLIVLPLSMQRDMATLSFTSCISVTADIILVLFVTFFSPVSQSVTEAGGFAQVLEEDGVRSTLFIGFGVLSAAMACQHSCFVIAGSLVNITRSRWSFVTGSSIGIATLSCAMLGTAGYLGFLDETEGDVLNNFDPNSVIANGARGLLALTMFFTYPMESFVARHVLSSIIYSGEMEGTDDMPPALACVPDHGWMNRRHKLTLGIYLITLIPALIFDDLGPVLSVTGSLGGCCLAYIAPGFIYLGVNGESFMNFCAGLLGRTPVEMESSAAGGNEIELSTVGSISACQPSTIEDGLNGVGSGENTGLEEKGSRMFSSSNFYSGSKPWWWYILGFPFWYAIARSGSTHTRERIEHYPAEDSHDEEKEPGREHNDVFIPTPTGRDFFFAIFFITFGVIAVVAGLVSNAWVHVYGLVFEI